MSAAAGKGSDRPFTVFLIAGEESGDLLGAGLMRALSGRLGDNVRYIGVGGQRMSALGLNSMYPMQEIGLHGIATIIPKLAGLVQRQNHTARAVLAERPDVFVTIDCPSFNLGVARRVRNADPSITNIHYVMPSVWAWRPGRAKTMARWIDRVLAILPFEPEVSRNLSGPPCSYVGHPLIERTGRLRPQPGERASLDDAGRRTLLVLPGSRRSEIRRLLQPFGETVSMIADATGPLDVVLPAVPHLMDEIRAGIVDWAIQPDVIVGEDEKFAAFRRAHAALAASGTVTLELALAGVPMVVAYRIDPFAKWFKLFLKAKSIVLSNLVLGENVIPELIDRQSTPERMAGALLPLLGETAERKRQLAAFAKLDSLMTLVDTTPSQKAAEIVLECVAERQRRLEIGT